MERIEKLYIIPNHIQLFRYDEPCEIIGLKMVTPTKGLDPRICYEVIFPDGVIEYYPITDKKYLQIKTLNELYKT
jgi:hypothetical protein